MKTWMFFGAGVLVALLILSVNFVDVGDGGQYVSGNILAEQQLLRERIHSEYLIGYDKTIEIAEWTAEAMKTLRALSDGDLAAMKLIGMAGVNRNDLMKNHYIYIEYKEGVRIYIPVGVREPEKHVLVEMDGGFYQGEVGRETVQEVYNVFP
ncbi:hypothetical protein [Brevibacillus dissolubilis]|uniref:hypothetical protein n=1 Tax=Brevibacillus dissolubilis TaxID=1844116 RepID=UPI001117A74E|nr:hypothetical protein [Brevibacillus dissolubilis]